jgi:hypothetical protein
MLGYYSGIAVTTGSNNTIIGGNFSISAATSDNVSIGSWGAERLRILASGAWTIGAGGTNYGTNGQVLTSSGSGAAPTWTTVSGTGTVTSVSGSGGTTGLTLTGGAITTSGTLTLGGTLIVANGGTGVATITAKGVVIGNGTSAVTNVVSTNGTNAPTTSYGILTTDVSNNPVWTDIIDGGTY